jgi:hypothetical protein
MENDKMAAFASGRKPTNPLELLSKTLGEAAVRPDVRPAEQGRAGSVALVERSTEAPQQQDAEVSEAAAPAQSQAEPQLPTVGELKAPQAAAIEDDGASYTLPPAAAEEVNRGGRPRHGAERKVERTISMDKSLDKDLLNLAIIESVRLGRRVSSAEVAVHLMQYALSKMKDNKVLPGEDGLGLELASTKPTAVVLPKLGG